MTSRTLVLVIALVAVAPMALANTVFNTAVPSQSADFNGRNYVALTGGIGDPTLGDVVVYTVHDGTFDLYYRFLNAPSDLPTPGDALRAPGCGSDARCLHREAGVLGDVPLATDPDADETFAYTDGRWVVYAKGEPGARDVYRADMRNADRPHVLVAGTSADEVPFGVGGKWVGIKRGIDATTAALDVRDVETLALRTTLATVNWTNSAAISSRAGAYETGKSLVVFDPNAASIALRHAYNPDGGFREVVAYGQRVAYIKSTCTGTCTYELRFVNLPTLTGTAPNFVELDKAPTTSGALLTRPTLFRVHLAVIEETGTTTRTHAVKAWEVQTPAATTPTAVNWNVAVSGPGCWTNTPTPAPLGSLAPPVFTNHYIVQLDFGGRCASGGPSPSVTSYVYASCNPPATQAQQAAGTGYCYGTPTPASSSPPNFAHNPR